MDKATRMIERLNNLESLRCLEEDELMFEEDKFIEFTANLGKLLAKFEPSRALQYIATIDAAECASTICLDTLSYYLKQGKIKQARMFAEAYDAYDSLTADPNPGLGYFLLVSLTKRPEDYEYALKKIKKMPHLDRCILLTSWIIVSDEFTQQPQANSVIERQWCIDISRLCKSKQVSRLEFIFRLQHQLAKGGERDNPKTHFVLNSLCQVLKIDKQDTTEN